MKRAFTLIELLVVVAVIAVLASLLFPVLNVAKSRAKQTQCASNMRQAVMAVLMYADDHDDTIAPYWGFSYLIYPYYAPKWWLLTYCPTATKWNTVKVGAVWCYDRDIRGRLTRLALIVRSRFKEMPRAKVKTTSIRIPSEAILFMDTGDGWGGQMVSPLESKLELDDDGQIAWHNGAWPRIHNGGSNTGLLDGHVEWVSYEALWHIDEEGEVTHPFWYPE